MYEGSAARRIDAYEGTSAQRAMQPSFGVVEGVGLDAQVRAGVSAQFIATLKLVALATVVLMTLSLVRVGIFTATASLLSENSTMRTELKEARASRDELRIERSVLSSSSRIERIATQTYGMVLAEGSETMTAGAAAAAAEAAAAEAAAQAATAESAEAPVQAEETTEVDSAVSAEAVEDTANAESQEASDKVADALVQTSASLGDGSTAGANAVDVDSL